MDVLLWALGILIAIQTTVTGFVAKAIFAHVSECRVFRAEVAAMKADLERVMTDIGTHETGLRGQVHELADKVSGVVLWYEHQMEKR